MNEEMRNRPVGGSGRLSNSLSESSISQPDQIPGTCPKCFDFYQAGFHDAQISQDAQAELAARRFYAMEQWEIDNRRRTQIDREWFDVARARAEQKAGVLHG